MSVQGIPEDNSYEDPRLADLTFRLRHYPTLPRGKGLTYNPMASLSDGTSFELGYIGKIEPLDLLENPDYETKDE
jgi:hypothetical protein